MILKVDVIIEVDNDFDPHKAIPLMLLSYDQVKKVTIWNAEIIEWKPSDASS